MTRNTRRVRAVLLVCAAVLVGAIALTAHLTNALQRLELATVDARFDVRGREAPPRDVLVVAIDDATFAEHSERWPFSRATHARAIRRLSGARPAAIAYDVQFTEESDDVDADTALIEAVRAAGNVVLATTEVAPGGTTKVFGGGTGLEYSRGTPANANYRKDSDGVLRRLAPELQQLETMPIAAARTARGRQPPPPPGGATEAWIDYPGPPGSVRTVSFVDVLRGRVDPALVRGRIVVVGATAPSLQDLHATPTTGRREMAGAEIQAAAAHTVLAGYPLRSAPGWLDALLVVALAMTAPLVALWRGIVAGLAAGAAAVVLLLAGAYAGFAGLGGPGTIVAVAVPLAAGAAALLAAGAIQAITVAFERARVRDAFARFVPEAVVDDVLRSADGVRLGGVRRECTVMFSDLRGFTTFAEGLDPEEVIAILNRYLTDMTGAVLAHGGTLVSYMGDGIMAVFGAPLEQPDHADRALAAARDMLARLESFNEWLRERGPHEGFRMGIGLNSGPVMSGNVGSEQRLEYTALGDTTNVAARLEGMTKGTPHQVFVAESTRAALNGAADGLVAVGEVPVRGRKGTVRVWAPA